MSHKLFVAYLIIYGDSPAHCGPEGENFCSKFSLVLLLLSWLDCKLWEDRDPGWLLPSSLPSSLCIQHSAWQVTIVN